MAGDSVSREVSQSTIPVRAASTWRAPGRREPEPFATALGVTGGDEAVETWLENLARHPNMLGDVAEAGLTGSLHETVHVKQCPQTTDVERAVRPAR